MHLFAAYVTSAMIILLRPFLKLSPLPITLKHFSITQGMVSYAVQKNIISRYTIVFKVRGEAYQFSGLFCRRLAKINLIMRNCNSL